MSRKILGICLPVLFVATLGTYIQYKLIIFQINEKLIIELWSAGILAEPDPRCQKKVMLDRTNCDSKGWVVAYVDGKCVNVRGTGPEVLKCGWFVSEAECESRCDPNHRCQKKPMLDRTNCDTNGWIVAYVDGKCVDVRGEGPGVTRCGWFKNILECQRACFASWLQPERLQEELTPASSFVNNHENSIL